MAELLHGSPAHRPLSSSEQIEWIALLTIVEPQEAREAREQARMEART